METLIGKKVFVYYNLHKNIWSVRCEKTKLVIAHVNTIVLKDSKYKVSEKGRQRILKEKKKNVHAGVQGIVMNTGKIIDLSQYMGVTYNPYKHSSFVTKVCGRPVWDAEITYMDNKKVYKKFTTETILSEVIR